MTTNEASNQSSRAAHRNTVARPPNLALRVKGTDMKTSKTSKTNYEKAKDKVKSSPRLRQYADFILADWPEGEDHWKWVVKATVKEIETWAEKGQL